MKAKLKPRRMWANYYPSEPTALYVYTTKAKALECANEHALDTPSAVAVIPLDDVEAMVLKARDAYFSAGVDFSDNKMRAALTAIGVLPKSRREQK